jgi:hypothetical protein
MRYKHLSLTSLQLGAWLQPLICRLWVEGIVGYRCNILQNLANLSFLLHLLQFDPQPQQQATPSRQPDPTLQCLGLDIPQPFVFSHAPVAVVTWTRGSRVIQPLAPRHQACLGLLSARLYSPNTYSTPTLPRRVALTGAQPPVGRALRSQPTKTRTPLPSCNRGRHRPRTLSVPTTWPLLRHTSNGRYRTPATTKLNPLFLAVSARKTHPFCVC